MNPKLIKNENAQLYTCGYGCDNALLLTCKEKSYFITDGRYILDASNSVKSGVCVVDGGRDLLGVARVLLRSLKLKSVTIDPNEWSIASYDRLFSKLHIKIKKVPNFSQNERIIKNQTELDILSKSATLGAKAFENFFEFVKNSGVGLSEKELSFEAKRFLTNNGKYGLSFEPIVAINKNSAKPHALADDTILNEGDLLLFDAGIIYENYCSDRTRTVEVGVGMSDLKAQKFRDKTRQKVYDIVLEAQLRAIEAVKVGAKTSVVDKAARGVIEKSGYGEFFVHSTGHGVGLDIHELPVVSRLSNTIIEEGMVFTIEPGIYLPEEFGVRIEDMVVATTSGAKVL